MPIERLDDPADDGTRENPVNREPPMDELISSWLTQEHGYDRNHGSLQRLDGLSHRVQIDGLVAKPLKLSMADLHALPQHSITCTLSCAGNRRHTMRTRIKEVSGVDWFDAAIMNCTWTGPRVSTVLELAGVRSVPDCDRSQQKHVQFANHSQKTQEDDWYGGSIPFDRAMDDSMDVILATKMNGSPLPTRNGFPVRVVVPGVLGARSVKWVETITVSAEESPNFYQRHDYKILPAEVKNMDQAEGYWSKVPAMLEMPVNAGVAVPVSGSTVHPNENGVVHCAGYAVPGGHSGPITKVELSGDEGTTWVEADIDPGPEELRSKWSWVFWSANVEMKKGTGRRIFAKATDRGGNTQEDEKSTWNLRGVGYNGYEAIYDLTVI